MKVRALAGQVLCDIESFNTNDDPLWSRATFDQLFLTAHDRLRERVSDQR